MIKVLELDRDTSKVIAKDLSQCADCGLIERDEHILKGAHVCNQITDYKFRVNQNMTLKIGKRRFVKLEVV